MKSNYPIVTLKGYVHYISQRNKGETNLDVYSVTNSEGFVKSTNYFSKEVFSKDISNYKVVRSNQFAYNPSRINVGSVDYLREVEKALVSPLYVVFKVTNEIYPDYLFRYLKGDWGNNQIRENTEGSVRDSLKFEGLERIQIPLPPLAEQKRIAAILDKADAIRRKRQVAIKLADDFLRATFLDKFGDPVTNPKGWDIVPLKKLGYVTTGNTPPRINPEFYGNDFEWIKSDNINTPYHYLSKATEYLSKSGKKVARTAPPLSTLVTCIAGSFNCIGNAALTDREVCFNQQINAITPYGNTDPFFLYVQILAAKKIIQNASTNSMKGMVSKGIFEQVMLFQPPKDLQRKFGLIIEKFLITTDTIRSFERINSALFNSLIQRAFRGEL